MANDTQFYIDVLKSEECACGKTKNERTSFCYNCYRALPPFMQKDVWKRLGFGYEEAYENAHEWLVDNDFIM